MRRLFLQDVGGLTLKIYCTYLRCNMVQQAPTTISDAANFQYTSTKWCKREIYTRHADGEQIICSDCMLSGPAIANSGSFL